jgi:hypothetical protein
MCCRVDSVRIDVSKEHDTSIFKVEIFSDLGRILAVYWLPLSFFIERVLHEEFQHAKLLRDYVTNECKKEQEHYEKESVKK